MAEREGEELAETKEAMDETTAWILANKQTATKTDIASKQSHLLSLWEEYASTEQSDSDITPM